MNHKPLVSVIMNCYNSEEHLREAIESVLAQTYSNWEIIFWDNQSTDSSASIFQGYADPRCRYFRAERHTSLGEARELASEKAEGQWLAFLDCDDIWLPRKLELQLNLLDDGKSMPTFIYCRTKLLVMDSRNGEWTVAKGAQGRYENRMLPEGDVFEKLLDEMFPLFLSVLIRKDCYVSAGGMDPVFRQAEDLDLLLRLARMGEAAVVQECCCYYRIHGNNITKKQRDLIYTETIAAMEKLGDDPLVKSAIRRTYARYFLYKLLRKMALQGAPGLFGKFQLSDMVAVIYHKALSMMRVF